MDEVEQVEAEGRLEEKQPKIPNGNLVNGTCSPDSGHPSSHNFSSGLSEHSEPSLSTEDSVLDPQRNASLVLRPGDSSLDEGQSSEAATSRGEAPREELAVQDSLESDLLANESMDEFMSVPGSMDVALPEKEGGPTEGWGGGADSEDNLSEEPEMESLFPALASLAVSTPANSEASPVSSSGVTYSVSVRGPPPLPFLPPRWGGSVPPNLSYADDLRFLAFSPPWRVLHGDPSGGGGHVTPRGHGFAVKQSRVRSDQLRQPLHLSEPQFPCLSS